ncbi:heme-binding protein [Streptomyces sp. NPDC057249]|uniref:heme-binding protein n=1 Tax=Streptomyces sp. NPDC057249 TaxID=3346067 RepID=UPI00363BDBD9
MSAAIVTTTVSAPSISREGASRLIGVAPEAAVGQDVSLAIAVTDAAGHLLAFEAMDGAPFLGHTVAVDKAGTAAAHRTVVGAALTQLGFTAA